MKKLIFILLPLLVAMAACGDDNMIPTTKPPYSPPYNPAMLRLDIPHYISGYFWPAEFEVYYYENVKCFALFCESEDWRDFVFYRNEGVNDVAFARYEELCRKNNDISFNWVRYVPSFSPCFYNFLATEIVSIDLIADKKWNGRPAGASWADLCWLKAITPREYIASGYTKVYEGSGSLPFFEDSELQSMVDAEHMPVSKQLSKCTAEDLKMVWCGRYPLIYLTAVPEHIDNYNFTLIINTDDGKVFESPVIHSNFSDWDGKYL